MKKIFIISIIFSLLFAGYIFPASTNINKKENCNLEFNIYSYILIGVDIALAGLTAGAIIQQQQLAGDYEKLFNQLDNTSAENYYRLLYEKEKVNSAGDLVLISGIATGVFVSYTLLDYFFLHKFFDSICLKTNVNINKNEVYSMINIEY